MFLPLGNEEPTAAFIPRPHTDYLFRVESSSRLVRFVGKLVTPLALLLLRLWHRLARRA
jgi:hypothetical protein